MIKKRYGTREWNGGDLERGALSIVRATTDPLAAKAQGRCSEKMEVPS